MPEHSIPNTPPIPAAHAALSLGDLIKYAGITLEIVGIFKGADSLAVGETETVPAIKVAINGKKFTWDDKGLTRTA